MATPVAAAALHLEVARRAASRAGAAVPEKTASGVATALAKLEQTACLLDVLAALGGANAGEPGLVDFRALATRAAREVAPRLEAFGLELAGPAGGEAIAVSGFGDELETAFREALLAAARWAGNGEARLLVDGRNGTASFSFCVPQGADRIDNRLFLPFSRPEAGFGPFLARWVFEAHGGRLEGSETEGFVTVTGSVPRVAP